MLHTFISYSSKDREFVGRLRADLQVAGVNIWIDQTGLKAGTRDWEQAVRDAIRNAHAVVLIASPNSRQSQPVKGEGSSRRKAEQAAAKRALETLLKN